MKKTTGLTKKIKTDYGSLKRFCEVNGIAYNTFKGVACGSQKSAKIATILIDHKYINNHDELIRSTV